MHLDSAVLYSHDVDKVVPFYTDVLGLSLEYVQEGKFASFIFPGGGRLGIKTKKEEREIPGHQTVFIGVENIEEVYEQIKQKDVTFSKHLVEMPWGKEFSILDPDSNKVEYLQRPA